MITRHLIHATPGPRPSPPPSFGLLLFPPDSIIFAKNNVFPLCLNNSHIYGVPVLSPFFFRFFLSLFFFLMTFLFTRLLICFGSFPFPLLILLSPSLFSPSSYHSIFQPFAFHLCFPSFTPFPFLIIFIIPPPPISLSSSTSILLNIPPLSIIHVFCNYFHPFISSSLVVFPFSLSSPSRLSLSPSSPLPPRASCRRVIRPGRRDEFGSGLEPQRALYESDAGHQMKDTPHLLSIGELAFL